MYDYSRRDDLSRVCPYLQPVNIFETQNIISSSELLAMAVATSVCATFRPTSDQKHNEWDIKLCVHV